MLPWLDVSQANNPMAKCPHHSPRPGPHAALLVAACLPLAALTSCERSDAAAAREQPAPTARVPVAAPPAAPTQAVASVRYHGS